MAKRNKPSRVELLELDIDTRLADLWQALLDRAFDEGWSEEQIEEVAVFMRAGYGKGYCDALVEDDSGALCQNHGYRTPKPFPSKEFMPEREVCIWPARY